MVLCRGFTLDEDSFAGMESLVHLEMRGLLTAVTAETLVSAPGLQQLDIRYFIGVGDTTNLISLRDKLILA